MTDKEIRRMQRRIDSENNLFDRLKEYKADMPNLISRRQFNDRRKFTAELCEKMNKLELQTGMSAENTRLKSPTKPTTKTRTNENSLTQSHRYGRP